MGAAAKVLDPGLTVLEALEFPVERVQFMADGHARLPISNSMHSSNPAPIFSPIPMIPIPNVSARSSIRLPALLWLRGNPQVLALPSIAVVGTRHPTPYGTCRAEMLSRDLAPRSLIILSGMARGVDTQRTKAPSLPSVPPSLFGERG